MNASSFPIVAITLLSIGSLSTAGGAEQTTAAPPVASGPAAERAKVDINTATIPMLEAVPEIGTNFANAVVAARPFKSVDDLAQVLRIGPDEMSELRRKVMASPVKSAPSPGPDKPATTGSKPSAVNEGKATDPKEVGDRYDRANPSRKTEKSDQKK
jgi:hypothetical protein